MKRCAITLSLLTSFAVAQDQEQDLWIQDFAAAKARAKAEKKDLLVDFTGSDWCGWCIKLDNEVFGEEAFQAEAPKHFVLVKLDYPRDKSILTEEIIAQNAALQATYAIQGFPTILLMTADGDVRPIRRVAVVDRGECIGRHEEDVVRLVEHAGDGAGAILGERGGAGEKSEDQGGENAGHGVPPDEQCTP